MTIDELLDLYFKQVESVCSENSIGCRILPQDLILKNKAYAKEELLRKTKEELVDYLLDTE